VTWRSARHKAAVFLQSTQKYVHSSRVVDCMMIGARVPRVTEAASRDMSLSSLKSIAKKRTSKSHGTL
jgi:hypothetical protein